MTKKKLLIGLLAFVLVFAMTVVGCDLLDNDKDDDSTNDNNIQNNNNNNNNNNGNTNGSGGTITSPTGIVMVSIPAGTFTMGSPSTESSRPDERPQHSVTLSGFSMSKYEVTQAQWIAVMGAIGTGESGDRTSYGNGDNYPIYDVNWYEALVFCNKLSIKEGLTPVYSINGSTDPTTWGTVPHRTPWDAANNAKWVAVVIVSGSTGYRLPTEAQWEYACRAGTTTAYNTTIADNIGWYKSNSGEKTHQVGLKPANAFGLHDMHGNVSEWCWDWFKGSYYSSSPTNDPMGETTGSNRVSRGGNWLNNADNLRSAYRESSPPYDGGSGVGFRLVRNN